MTNTVGIHHRPTLAFQGLKKPLSVHNNAPFSLFTNPLSPFPPSDTLNIQFSGHRFQPNNTEKAARAFIRKHVQAIQPLRSQYYETYWNTLCQGANYVEPGQERTNYKRQMEAHKAYMDYFNNPEACAEAKALFDQRDKIASLPLRLQIETLYKWFRECEKSKKLLKLEQRLSEKQAELTGIFNNYQAIVDGETLSQLEITQRLENSDSPGECRKLWTALASPGLMPVSENSTLAEMFVDLVKLRNEVARKTRDENGKYYSDYFSMQLAQYDINEEMLTALLDQIEEATREPFETYLKAEHHLSQTRYGIPLEEAGLPWYGSGSMKRLFNVDIQSYLKGRNPLALIEATANTMGNSVQEIFDRSVFLKNGELRSSIYFEPGKDDGKSQHWFSCDVTSSDDVRLFGSADPTFEMMMDSAVQTILHETPGHGLDSIQIGRHVPYLLRGHHAVTTESHAMLHENLMQDAQWWERIAGLPKEKAEDIATKARVMEQASLIKQIRYLSSLTQFERQMYKNPDQDLTQLWWDLQEKYLGEKQPPDCNIPAYIRIPHFFSHPVYMPNYILADLARAQKLAFIKERYGSLMTPEAGEYLKTYRAKGNLYRWEDLIERMTGKPLGTEALKKEFADFQLPEPV